jgi:chromosome segregation ATPase
MSFVFDIAAAQQAGAIGKYNQGIQNRNAQVKEQEAQQIEKQLEFDIAQFDKQFEKLEGTQIVNTLKSGAEFSGSASRIARANAEEAELQKQVMEYNSKIGQAQKMEEANFARMQGGLARMQAKQAQLGYYAKAGQSLLKMGGYTS